MLQESPSLSEVEVEAGVLEREVLDLLLEDERLVRQMFEDIITAEWPVKSDAPASAPPGVGGTGAGNQESQPPAHGAHRAGQLWMPGPGSDRWARERSPPSTYRHLLPIVPATKPPGGDAPT